MKTDWNARGAARTWTLALLALLPPGTLPARNETRDDDQPARTLYVWAGDQARVAPDFLAVIDFDEDSPRYGKVIRTVPVPGPGGSGNEPHHCNLSADKNILACGGLLALLKGQNSFLNEDGFGKIHFEGDHHVRVIKVFKKRLALDRRFDVDFNTAFPTGPARPHGVAMK